MNRSLLAAPAVAALLLAGVAGIASAGEDEPTGPDCTAEQQIVDAIEAGPPGTPSLLELRAAVDAAIAADNQAGLVTDSEVTADAKIALGARTEQLAAVQLDLDACLAAGDEPITDPEPTPTESPEPPATQAPAPPAQFPDTPPFADCDAARAAGAAPITVGNPGYRPALDTDADGVACEEDVTGDSSPVAGDAVLGGADDSNSGTVTQVPAGSIDTGYAA